MGLIAFRNIRRRISALGNLLARLRYRYGWRLRHWWMDTLAGRNARRACAVLAVLAIIVGTIRSTIIALRPAPLLHPHEAWIWVVIWLVIAILAAVYVANMPRPEGPTAPTIDTPSVQDGQPVIIHFGTCRVLAPALLAWKVISRDPIPSSGKK